MPKPGKYSNKAKSGSKTAKNFDPQNTYAGGGGKPGPAKVFKLLAPSKSPTPSKTK